MTRAGFEIRVKRVGQNDPIIKIAESLRTTNTPLLKEFDAQAGVNWKNEDRNQRNEMSGME